MCVSVYYLLPKYPMLGTLETKGVYLPHSFEAESWKPGSSISFLTAGSIMMGVWVRKREWSPGETGTRESQGKGSLFYSSPLLKKLTGVTLTHINPFPGNSLVAYPPPTRRHLLKVSPALKHHYTWDQVSNIWNFGGHTQTISKT